MGVGTHRQILEPLPDGDLKDALLAIVEKVAAHS